MSRSNREYPTIVKPAKPRWRTSDAHIEELMLSASGVRYAPVFPRIDVAKRLQIENPDGSIDSGLRLTFNANGETRTVDVVLPQLGGVPKTLTGKDAFRALERNGWTPPKVRSATFLQWLDQDFDDVPSETIALPKPEEPHQMNGLQAQQHFLNPGLPKSAPRIANVEKASD